MADRDSVLKLFDETQASFDALRAEFEAYAPPPPPSNVLRLKVGDNVQSALTSLLKSGGIISMAPGLYPTDLVIPERQPTDKLITFTSDTTAIPPVGTRITPEYAPSLAFLQNITMSGSVIKGKNKSRNLAFVGIGIAAPLNPSMTQVSLGGDQHETFVPTDVPTNYVFDRVLVLGDPLKGAHRGIQMHCNGIVVQNSYFKDIFEIGRDSQAVSSWNGGRNILLQNNYFEASGENVMFGGSDSASAEMTTQDVVMRGNTFAKNFDWMKLATKPAIKSLFEIKNVKRLLAQGNVFEKNWAKDWPTGVAIMLKACNGEKNETWATCEDVSILDSIVRDVGSVFGIVGYGDSGRVSDRARRIVIQNILAYRINKGTFLGTGKGCPVANPPDGLTIDHVSMIKNGHSWMNTWFDSGQGQGEALSYTNNVVCLDAYGYISDPNGIGFAAIPKDWKASKIAGNVYQAGTRNQGTMPPDNMILASTDFDACLDSSMRVKPGSVMSQVRTTDGKLPGADVDAIVKATGATI